MSAGYTQEQDGSKSMRRLLAAYYAVLSGILLIVSAIKNYMAGVYAGLGCGIIMLALLGLATFSDIKLKLPLIGGDYATEEREFKADYSREYQEGNRGGEATETGGGDSIQYSEESEKALME